MRGAGPLSLQWEAKSRSAPKECTAPRGHLLGGFFLPVAFGGVVCAPLAP